MAFAPLHLHGPSPVAVINGPAPRCGAQAVLDDVARDLDDLVFYHGTGTGQHFAGIGMPAFETDLFDDLEGGLADLPDLIVGQDAHTDRSLFRPCCLQHRFTPVSIDCRLRRRSAAQAISMAGDGGSECRLPD